MARIAASSSIISSPSTSASASRVRSSLVGPSPPVTMSASPSSSPMRMARPTASPSGTVICLETLSPTRRSRWPIHAPWVFCVVPRSSSVPVVSNSICTKGTIPSGIQVFKFKSPRSRNLSSLRRMNFPTERMQHHPTDLQVRKAPASRGA